MIQTETPGASLLRDQQRALHAYEAVSRVTQGEQKDYKIAVNDLGANILRSGLCAALASLQRIGPRGDILLGHLASAGIPSLEKATAQNLAKLVRELGTEDYMMATREFIQVATWLKRAVQATFRET